MAREGGRPKGTGVPSSGDPRHLPKTDADRDALLQHLAEYGVVARACAATRISRQTAYEWRKDVPGFADRWAEALEQAADEAEAEARRRALYGVQEPVVQGGKIVKDDDGKPLMLTRYSDTLLIVLLKMSGRFVDSSRHEVTGKDGGALRIIIGDE